MTFPFIRLSSPANYSSHNSYYNLKLNETFRLHVRRDKQVVMLPTEFSVSTWNPQTR